MIGKMQETVLVQSIGQKEEKTNKKIYNKPKVAKLGAMQKYTLGGSVGFGDSGNNDTPECWPGSNC